MGNVTLPTPVFVAGGAFALLAGYVAGSLVSGGNSDQQVAKVVSFHPQDGRLCLGGDAVKDAEAAKDGVLCGTWSHSPGVRVPRKGDSFRFVTLDRPVKEKSESTHVVIFGTVVG